MSNIHDEKSEPSQDNVVRESPDAFFDDDLESENDANAPVLAFTAQDAEEAEVIRATLDAAGIEAILEHSAINPVLGGLGAGTRDTSGLGILVPPSQFEAAQAILTMPSLSEEELAAEQAADPTTLEEAEADIKHA